MKNRKKLAFTLIELLAVIVVLAILALIIVPTISGVISMSKKNVFESSVRSVFNAVDYYLSSSEEHNIPSEGLNITSNIIPLKHNRFTSGKVLIRNNVVEVEKIGYENYCANGTFEDLKIYDLSCIKLDITKPLISIVSTLARTNSIDVTIEAVDPDSGIKGYYYSLDDGENWTDIKDSNSYTFINLVNDKEYKIKAKAINGNDLEATTETVSLFTSRIDPIIYSIDKEGWQKSKIVTINYPKVANQDLIYEYSKEKGSTWEKGTDGIKLTYNDNGTLIARVSDGTNTLIGNVLSITQIDNTKPTCGSVTGASKSWTSSNRTINVACIDDGECSLSSFSQTYTTTLTTSSITISDKAGNTNSCSVDVYIDKTKPTMTSVRLVKSDGSTYTSGTTSSQAVTAYQSANDNVGILKYLYSSSSTSGYIDMPTNWTINWDGNWMFYVKAVDIVGNISDNYISYSLIIRTPVNITNMVTNGGFETGNISGWNKKPNQGGTAISTTDRAEGTYAGFFSPQDNNYWALRYQNIWSTAGHVYYARTYAKTGMGSAGIQITEFTAETIKLENTGSSWARISSYFRAGYSQWGTVTAGAFIQHVGQANFVDSIMVIDLTAAYGSGSEPSQAWCDNNIPFFSGTISANRP